MGHSSITVTLDRYGHLMPGHEEEAAMMLASYLEPGSRGMGAAACVESSADGRAKPADSRAVRVAHETPIATS
jgi:hypothetical protein